LHSLDVFKVRREEKMTSPLQQKVRVNGPVVVTANRLSDGAVVHRTAWGSWSEKIGAAEIFWTGDDAQRALKAAQAQGLEAVGAYIAPIDASEKTARPGNLRELIRATGPTFQLPSDETAHSLSSSAEAEKAAA
jgi:hypothetical protein